MIVLTGVAGFISSCLLSKLNAIEISNVILVDDFSKNEKQNNLKGKEFQKKIERSEFISWFEKNGHEVSFVFHLGARTDTTEFDARIFEELNINFSKAIWNCCTKFSIPLVYASSAATYGMGEYGYDDHHHLVNELKPLNPYGESKNDFDKWALIQEKQPPFWAGLKFFNVYGPNEYHKGRMASVIFHAFNQIKETGSMKLFRSHHADYSDGEQMRDFVYVMDVVEVCLFLYHNHVDNGLYNLGSGTARTFKDLVKATFAAMNMPEQISFIDTPLDIRDKYQYFTEANMNKLLSAGFPKDFHSLEEGVQDYVQNYLLPGKYL